MHFSANSYSVTTGLVAAFGLFVVYMRLKNWLDSNIPIFFYVIALGYMRAVDGAVPFWLICTSFALCLLLRFEFMNGAFTQVVRFLELGTLAGIIFLSVGMVLRA
ncbi:MAG TPA: hypothetical protein VMH80_01300 [Bryobacteraceae bacterium]|nr:hypothetical protein [Bryobacteraceae bacterium]